MTEINTPAEAVKFLTEAAWKTHSLITTGDDRSMKGYDARRSCAAWHITGPDKAELKFENKCDCGAREHNENVKKALMIIGGAAKARRG
jgi:hypothetical protein